MCFSRPVEYDRVCTRRKEYKKIRYSAKTSDGKKIEKELIKMEKKRPPKKNKGAKRGTRLKIASY